MRNFKKLFCLLLCLVFILPFAGCGDTKEAYIYFELPAVPETLDPQIASSDSELIIIRNIQEGLMRKNDKGEIVCGIAESYEKKGMTYTFKLREDAKWNNGDKITAHDFVFAFKRALNPETNAPFATRLYSIKNAKAINNGTKSLDKLGVKALDDGTLKITLTDDDENFLEALTTAVAMPCNEKFFNESAGKYGLFDDNILSSGSYRLSRWRKESFGIRLYKNEDYSGFAKAQNAAVFITCDDELGPLEKLKKNSVDMAFIDSSKTTEAVNSGLKTCEFQNICWVLTLGEDFSPNMRKALSMLVGGEVYGGDLPTGYSSAISLFPSVFGKIPMTGMTGYEPEKAKELYLSELELYEDKKFPSDVVLKYYDDGNVKNVVTDIVGHWQNNLSAFVNIEAVGDRYALLSQLEKQTEKMAIFCVRADSSDPAEYLRKFGVSYNGEKLTGIQSKLLKSNRIVPIMFQNTVISFSPALSSVYSEPGNGYIDFSFIVKKE